MIGLGLGLNKSRVSAISFIPQSEAWWAEMPTQPSDTRKAKDNTFISALVSSGVYSELDVLFIRGTEYEDNSNISIIDPANIQSIKVGSPLWTQNKGFRSASNSDYLNWDWIPATDGINFTTDLGSIFFFIVDNRDFEATDLGAGAGGGKYLYSLTLYDNSSIFSFNNNGGTSGGAILTPSVIGLIELKRISSTSVEVWKNGVLVNTYTQSTTGGTTQSLFENAFNNGGSALFFSNRRLFLTGAGSGNWDSEQLYTDVSTYFNSVTSFPTSLYGFGDSILEKYFTSYKGACWFYQFCIQKDINGFNYGLVNESTTSALVRFAGGSGLPTKTRSQDKILWAWGVNDCALSTPIATMKSNLDALLALFLAKGWSAADIIYMKGYNCQDNISFTRSTYDTYIAGIQDWCTTNSVGQVIDASAISYTNNADNIHPANNAAHSAIAAGLASQITIS